MVLRFCGSGAGRVGVCRNLAILAGSELEGVILIPT